MIPISDKEKIEAEQEMPDLEKVETETADEEVEEVVKEEPKEEKKAKKKEKKASKDDELAAAKDQYLRLFAEFDNYKKRTSKEKENLYGNLKVDVIKDFLPVYDNLARALSQQTEDEAYYKGVEMIMTQFNTTLEKLGVTEIPALGEKFDPNVHNAVMHVDDEDKGENEIVEVFQKGFMMGDKVIRFAMVKVAN